MRLTVFLLFFSSCVCAQPNSITRNYTSGIGPVMANDGLGSFNSAVWRDENNLVVEEVHYYDIDNIYRIKSRAYDQDNNLVTTKTIEYPKFYWSNLNKGIMSYNQGPDTTIEKRSYLKGQLMKVSTFKRNGRDTSMVVYIYNGDQLKEVRTIDQWKHVSWKEFRTYKGQDLISKTYWRGINYSTGHKLEPSSYVEYKYDSRHRLVKELWSKDSVSKPSSGKAFKYTDFDSVKSEGYIRDGQLTWNKVYFYDHNHRLTHTISGEYTWYYTYDKDGYLVETKSNYERVSNENIRKYVYDRGNMIREETHYEGKRSGYEELFYSKSGKLIRKQPMKTHERQKALDWIKKYQYNDQGLLSTEEYIHPKAYDYTNGGVNILVQPGTIGGWNSQGSNKPEPDPYKDYEHSFTYYEYDDNGELVRTYVESSPVPLVLLTDSGYTRYSGINPYTVNALYGNKADTISDVIKGSARIISYRYNQIYPPFHNVDNGLAPNMEVDGDQFLQQVKRIEYKNSEGIITRLVEYDSDGQLLCLYQMKDGVLRGKKLSSFVKRGNKQNLFCFIFNPVIRIQAKEIIENGKIVLRVEPSSRGADSIYYHYKNGKLFRDYHLFAGGVVKHLTEYRYDKKGFKTTELVYDQYGTLNYRVLYKNDGKNIIEKRRQSVSEGSLIKNVIEYL